MQKILHILAHIGAARAYAAASHAKRRKVGAVITYEGSPVACGWNGTPPGHPNQCETDDGSATLPTVVHAEPNALDKLKGIQLIGAVEMFVTCLPCPSCANAIAANTRVKRVFFGEVYRSLEGAKILLDSGVDLYFVYEHYGQVFKIESLSEEGSLVMRFASGTPSDKSGFVEGDQRIMGLDGVIMRR